MEASDLRAGDVLLYSSQSLIGKLIRFLDGTDVTHAGIYLGNDEVGEALMVGNAGINKNPISTSFAGTDWVEVRRLIQSDLDLKSVLNVADEYIADGNRYAYVEILLLAVILMTRKVNLEDSGLGSIAWYTFRNVNDWINDVFEQGREPMICSEFVFRCYDEAEPGDDDPYSIEVLSQAGSERRRRFSRFRRRERILTAQPESDLPTIHPESILSQALKEPAKLTAAATVSRKEALDVSTELIENMISDFLGLAEKKFKTSVGATKLPSAKISKEDLEVEAAQLAANLTSPARSFFKVGPYATAPLEAKATAAFADFVTPGDLFKSPSLKAVGRFHS